MKTLIDLTEDEAGQPGDLPSPVRFLHRGGVVVTSLREVDLRMTLAQFAAFTEGARTFLFRNADDAHKADCDFDLDKDVGIPAEEHDWLRRIVTGMIEEGKVGDVAVPVGVVDALRRALAGVGIQTTRWVTADAEMARLGQKLERAEAEVAALRRRRRKEDAR